MSLLECYKRSFKNHRAVHNPESSKLVTEDKVVNGIAVVDYAFKTQRLEDDPRQSLKYQDLCLGNLQRLGVTSDLKRVMLQKDDVDIVEQEVNKLYEASHPQIPAKDN